MKDPYPWWKTGAWALAFNITIVYEYHATTGWGIIPLLVAWSIYIVKDQFMDDFGFRRRN